MVENLELRIFHLLAALVTVAADPSSALQVVATGLVLVLVFAPLLQLIPPALGVVARGLVWFGFGPPPTPAGFFCSDPFGALQDQINLQTCSCCCCNWWCCCGGWDCRGEEGCWRCVS